MKFGELKSIGHNIAHSLASGIGLMIGIYQMDIFAEAASSPEGYVEVDFLSGTSTGGRISETLAKAISRYSEELNALCRRHGTEASAFRELKVRYLTDLIGERFVVTIEDQSGRRSTDEFVGFPGRRAKVRIT